MPLFKTIDVNSQTTVKIWKITESFNVLKREINLKPENETRVLGMKSEIHQCGFLSVRCLLNKFGYKDSDLFYDVNGKPHLMDGKHISISHSFIFSAVIISNEPVGIDIEKQRDKIAVIKHKFLDYECSYLNENDADHIKQLTVLWCIKESLYKLYAMPGLSFKNHCLVIPFSNGEDVTAAWIDYNDLKTKFAVRYLEFEGFTCSYALKSI
ncbi:4'-phosphopantetheinyl transferase superfamily protein [Aestuariivivens sp. NBU2969]|uniref:4'-phosphopantetheinyl transferase family protein n=1 Tax=Aestuariivivens sp. NBU2969 TaxID=2873267 RepID=UPI001CC10906|nr:4'-phosphopantetheinyl transferase superfamily protein [Aestuariivivens sp. NBU2969]